MNTAIVDKIFNNITEDMTLMRKYNAKISDSNIILERDEERYTIETFYDTIHLVSVFEQLKDKFPIDIVCENEIYIVSINKSKYRKYIIKELMK